MKKHKETIAFDPEVEALAQEVKAILTERIFNAREETINAHHETGKLMHDYLKTHKGAKITALVQQMKKLKAGASERTLYYCNAFYDKFPNIEDTEALGHGKNLSWNKIKVALGADKDKGKKIRTISFEVSLESWAEIVEQKAHRGDTIRISALDAEVIIKIKE